MRLSQLKRHQVAVITAVVPTEHTSSAVGVDAITTRLVTLGFVPGEQVRVLAKGLFGGDPVLVQIGFTRFALRLTEAARIEVRCTESQA